MKALQALLTLILLAAVIGSAISLVWARNDSRTLFVRLTALQNQRDAMNIEYGRLELEQATFAEPRRIDEEARQQLGMVDPRPQDIRLLRR